jgi:hypothetical protein
MATWVSSKLLKKVEYRRWRKLNAFTDSLFVVAFLVVICDLFWVIGSLLRFGSEYPFYPDVFQLLLCIGRDAVAIIFCFILIKPLINQKIVTFNEATFQSLVVIIIFFIAWFVTAPTPGYVCWNFAIKNDYPQSIIVNDFLMSHVIGRILFFFLLYNFVEIG